MPTREVIEIVTRMVDEFSGKSKKITETINRMSNGVIKSTKVVEDFDQGLNTGRVIIDKTTKGLRRFNFAWLSIMFAGMALNRVFGGLIKSQFELWGVTDMFSATLSVVFIPLMSSLIDILFPIMEWFMNLPEPVQKAIGIFVLLATGIGILLTVIGSVMLAVQGFAALWPAISATALPTIGGIIAALAPFIAIIAIIVAVVIGMYLAWKTNFLGMKQTVENFVNAIKQSFGGLVDIFKGVLSILKGIFTGDFTLIKEGLVKIFKGLFDFIVGGFKAAFNLVVGVVKGALMIVYNIIKAIIDGIGWIVGKVGKLFGGTGEPAWKLPSFQMGGIMPETGLAYLHKGERITPANEVNSSPMMNITVNANVSSDYDVRRIADQLKQYFVNDYERLIQRRGI